MVRARWRKVVVVRRGFREFGIWIVVYIAADVFSGSGEGIYQRQ